MEVPNQEVARRPKWLGTRRLISVLFGVNELRHEPFHLVGNFLTRALLKGPVPWSEYKMSHCQPFLPFDYFSNHLKCLTRQGFTGLLNVSNFIMHPHKQILAGTLL